ncbi:MAG TPA: hypothetical protein DDY68_04090 [Porphyromonadaceae bacterium]|nr:hypothetical protein [Porphyromonadaceae bacterium]
MEIIGDIFRELYSFFTGKLLAKFVNYHLKPIVLLVMLTFVRLTNTYSGEKELLYLEELKKELVDTQAEVQSLQSEWMRRTRSSSVYMQLQEMSSKIAPSKSIPRELKK